MANWQKIYTSYMLGHVAAFPVEDTCTIYIHTVLVDTLLCIWKKQKQNWSCWSSL